MHPILSLVYLLLACPGTTGNLDKSPTGSDTGDGHVDSHGSDSGAADDSDAADDSGTTDDSGPDDSGPDDSGPDDSGPDDSGPDDSGPDDSGDPPDADGDGVPDAEDCAPGDPEIYPGATESCNGVDDDCDDAVDEGLEETWYEDGDGDGYGDPSTGIEDCAAPTNTVADDTDCDDLNAEVHPGALEFCNGLDDDCDAIIDPASAADAPIWYADGDSDGFGDPTVSTPDCTIPYGMVSDDQDCDDHDAAVNPDALERCDAIDNDCDGVIDPDSSVDAATWYSDGDADGYGDLASTVVACETPAGAVADATDCDDSRADISPAGAETCDGADEDCNGIIDDATSGGVSAYADSDGDGYGDDDLAVTVCAITAGVSAVGGDCDDGDDAINPDALELCGDGIDQNCDTSDTTGLGCAPLGLFTSSDTIVSGKSTAELASFVVLDDVTGEGNRELVVGAPTATSSTGMVYLISGLRPGVGSSSVSVAKGDYTGKASGDSFGAALAALDDWDGDGLTELAVGAPGNDDSGSAAGAVYLFSGTASGTVTTDAIVSFLGEAAGDALGSALSNAGDTDGDGVDDLLMGAAAADTPGSSSGAVWLALGEDLTGGTLTVGDQLRFSGAAASDGLAASAGGGDLDGDGYGDLVLAAAGHDESASSAGAAWVWFGAVEQVGDRQVAAAPLRILGAASSDLAGTAVRFVGDTDGDGTDDLAIGATGTDSPASAAGSVGLFFGPLPTGQMSFDAANLVVTGVAKSDAVGSAISGGDINADGWADLLLGVPSADHLATGEGGAFVFYGPLADGDLDLTDADASLYSAGGTGAGTTVLASDLDADGTADVLFHSETTTGDRVEIDWGGTLVGDSWTAPDLDADDDGDGYAETAGDCDDQQTGRSPALTETCGAGTDEDCDGLADRCLDSGALTESDLESLVTNDKSTTSLDLGERVQIVGDINGDGALDVAAQDDRYASLAGRVLVFYGPVPAGTSTGSAADLILEGVSAGDYSGEVMAPAGDLDGDGWEDLLIGSPSGSRGATTDGFVSIFRGGPGLAGTYALSSADWIIYGNSAKRYAGWGGGKCDLDGDGSDDLIVGASQETVGSFTAAGTLSVIYGPISTGVSKLDDLASLVFEGDIKGGYVGEQARCFGDLTGDGQDDLLVYAPDWSQAYSGSTDVLGRWLIFDGPLPASGTLATSDADVAITGPPDGFQDVWTIGDVTGDGLPDLVLSVDDSAWSVVELAGLRGPVELDEMLVATLQDPTGSISETLVDLEIGDLDRDGIGDLVIGSASSSSAAGEVRIFFGPLEGDYSIPYADLELDGSSGHVLGKSIAIGDLEQDGFDDLVIGMRDYGSTTYKTGAFGVLRGGWTSRTGGATSPHTADQDHDGDGWTGEGGDCHDGDASVHPGASEICGDDLDEDCDGRNLECAPTGEREDLLPALSLTNGADGPEGYLTGLSDLDGDGWDELLLVDDYYTVKLVPLPLPMVGKLDPAYLDATTVLGTGGTYIYNVGTVADLDGDGKREALVSAPDGARILDSGSGTAGLSLSAADWVWAASTSTWGTGARAGGDPFGGHDAGLAVPNGSASISASKDGVVYLFGVDASAPGTYDETDAELVLVGAAASDAFGSRMNMLGDLDGDGLAELGASTSKGGYTKDEVTYIWGASEGTGTITVSDLSVQLQDVTSYSPMKVWSPGDLDGDGLDELAVAHPSYYESTYAESGRVFLWYGMPAAGTTDPFDADVVVYGDAWYQEVGDGVGESVDFDGDGDLDLIIGASSQYVTTSDQGRVHVWYGPLTLSGSVAAVDSDGTIVPDSALQDFGLGLTSTGDVDGDGYQDLWCGGQSTFGVLARGGPR